ncbi:MAG: DUF1036 domain-containing protein [Gammaproteobacteria bacterium]|nr:DUF1036 domain-containing protein [Gammaproteobacteria bacterium]
MSRLRRSIFLLALVSAGFSSLAEARLEVCNRTDLVLMVAVGYDTAEDRVASEGWWRVYPGYCEVPVDVALVKGSYYLHAESNPRSTMPDDAFVWGEEVPLCVQLADFRLTNARQCEAGNVSISFNPVDKNWRNTNKVDIHYTKRTYEDYFSAKIAGVQRMLSILGQDIGEIDGVLNEATVDALNEIGLANVVAGFDFRRIYPVLEQMIAKQHKLDN